jgi:DnaJ-domain-containing protein 1
VAERFRRVEAVGSVVRDSPLLFGLASVFAGLTTMLAVVAIVTREVVVLAIALPFAATGYFMWYQATGRMRERVAQRTTGDADPGRFTERKAREGTQRGVGAERARSRFAREARERVERERRRRAAGAGATATGDGGRRTVGGGGGARARGRRRTRRGGVEPADEPSLAEARDVLDVDADATQERVREAYRERVKEVHPDTADGDEEAFKRVAAAYDRLSEE